MPENKHIFSFGRNNNLAIKASAGTGKTFRLAMRFIALLHCFPKLDPEQIVAITFTRKAAAEILDKIIEQLLEIKNDPKKLADLVKDDLLPPDFTTSAVPGILERILTARNLQISTIDSFLVKIIQAFAPEFGLTGTVEMIDENRDNSKAETVAELIRRERKNLLEPLREYAQGKDARNFTSTLNEFLDDNYETYLLYPDSALWGKLPEADGHLSSEELERICNLLKVALTRFNPQSEAGCDAIKKIETLMKAATSGNPGDLKRPIQMLEAPDGTRYIKRGNITKDFTKLAPISPEVADALDELPPHIAVTNLHLKKAKTRAAYHILERYDALYAASVRNAGRLTFRDIPKVLGKIPWEDKQNLEYRLDTRNLHYMLDEFQDTSTQQWSFMSNLMNEAISGPDQTFFMVGDVKQSLYQWRFGNPKLFDAVCQPKINQQTLDISRRSAPASVEAVNGVFDEYNRDKIENDVVRQQKIDQQPLDISRRSAPAIMEAVNGVFDKHNRDKIENDMVRQAIERLQFTNHQTVKKDSGCVKLQQVDKLDDENARAAARSSEIIALLTRIEPFKHNLSVAILFRSNKEIARYKRRLQEIDSTLPLTTEGVVQPKESMACTFLTLLLRLAAHPGDSMAKNALPLFSWEKNVLFTAEAIAKKMQLPGSSDFDALASNLRILLQETGLYGVVSRFQSAYAPELSEFDRDRLAVAAAQAVDFPGSVDEYLTMLEKLKSSGVSTEKTVQLMTIHKSKGLEFDVVILPELGPIPHPGGDSLKIAPMQEASFDNYVSEDSAWLKPDFISYLPGEFSRQFLPEIEQIYERIKIDETYEKVCGLYVAMTRAKRALYMFVEKEDTEKNRKKTKQGKTFREDQLLIQTLGSSQPVPSDVLYLGGTDDWYLPQDNEKEKQPETPPQQPCSIPLTELSAKRPAATSWSSPSRHEESIENAALIRPEYRFDGDGAAELGTRLHAMFEAVEYFDSVNREKIRALAGEDELAVQAMSLWDKAMVPDSEFARLLQRPQSAAELWRERKFLLRDQAGNLISGCFDRVEIERDASGHAERAVIYDYKSDALAAPENFLEKHGKQLNAYRKACSQMLNLPENKIRCVILSVRLGKAIDVPAEATGGC